MTNGTNEKKVEKEDERQGEWLSRKLILSGLGILAIFFIALIAIDSGNKEIITAAASFATSIAGVAGGYSLGQGYADGQKTKKVK